MKFRKYFKSLFRKSSLENSEPHHKRKLGVFWGRFIRILSVKLIVFTALIFFLLYFGTAFAQAPIKALVAQITKPKPIVQSSKTLSANVQSAIQNLAGQEIKQAQANASLPVNLSIDNSDQTNVGLLDEFFAANPGDKAKVKIKKIDGRIRQLQILLTKDKSDKAINDSIKLIAKIGEETDKVATDPNVVTDREVLGLVIEQYNRLQLILQQLEDTLPINDYLKIEDARKKYLVATATNSINAAPNLDAVHNIAIKEVEKVVGEDFAELKAIEIISDFEADVRSEAREKLIGLAKELAVSFEKKMLKLPRDVRNRKLQDYIQYSFGDPILQLHSFNRIKDALTDREIILGVDSLKEIAFKKLIGRIFELETQEDINQFLERVIQSPEDLKILAEMQLAVNSGRDEARKQKLAQMTKSVEGRVAKFFASGNLESYFAPQKGKPTDILDMLLVSNLQAIISTTPGAPGELKQKFADIKNKTRKAFLDQISAKDFLTKSTLAYNPVSANADVRVLLSSPQAIQVLQLIKNESQGNEKSTLDIAIRSQSAILQEHILVQVKDPEIFEDYAAFINQNIQVRETLKTYAGQNFFTNLSKRSQIIQKAAKADEQKLYEVMQQIVQAIFITKDNTDFEKKLPSEIQQQIVQLKKTLPNKNIPQMALPEGINLPKIARLSNSIEQAIIQAAKQRIKVQQQSEEVKLDLTVQAKDLGISDPAILPDNPLYSIKKLMRTIQLVLAFDPLQRAQALIKQDNEKTLEAAKLLEKSSSRKTINLVLVTLSDVEKDFAKLKENSAKLDTLRQEQPKRVDAIVDQIIRNGLARQTVFSSIEDKVYGKDYIRVEKIRQSVLKDGVESLLRLTGGNAQVLVQKLEQAVNAKSGSKFKELRAIELLTEIKRFQPEKIGLILESSEVKLVKAFEAKLLAIEKKEREQELLAYADSMPGNPIRQFEAYEQLKDSFENSETLLLAEALTDKAVENLREQVSEITDDETLQEFVNEAVGNKPEDLKIIIEIELRVETPQLVGELATPIEQKVSEIKTEVEQNIIETVISDPNSLSESDLFAYPSNAETVSVIDVIVVKELEDILERTPEVSPEVVTTIQELADATTSQFIESVSNTTEASAESLQALEPVPQIIAELIELKEEASSSVDVQIDAAIAAQVDMIEEYLTTEINDPATFETYIAQIQENPVVAETIAAVGGTEFREALEETAQEITITAETEQTLLEETVTAVTQEIFSDTGSSETIIETLFEAVEEEIQQVQEEIPVEQIPEVTVAAETTLTTEPVITEPPVPVETFEPAVEAPVPDASDVKPPEEPVAPAAPAVPGL